MNIDDAMHYCAITHHASYIAILCHDNHILIDSIEIITFNFLKYKVIIYMEIRSYSNHPFIYVGD